MTTRAVFLTEPYSAYKHTAVPREDSELTHVGPGTPCGEYLRRFWQPVCLTSELTDLPMAIKIMGEEIWSFSGSLAAKLAVWSFIVPTEARPWSSVLCLKRELGVATTDGYLIPISA